MKAKFWKFLLLAATTAYVTALHAFQNEPDGFRGIQWEEQFTVRAKEMNVLRENKGGTKWYVRKGEEMSFGKAELTQVMYGYAHGKFLIVHIETSGARNRQAITDEFLSRFGKPNEAFLGHSWGGSIFDEQSKSQVSISLHCGYNNRPGADPKTIDDCFAQIMSLKLMKEIAAEKNRLHEEEAARRYGTNCPTATKIETQSKDRYIDVIEANDFGPRSFGWVFTDTEGWAIFRDTKYDNDYFANRAGFLAVRKSTIRANLVMGSRLSTVAPYFGTIGTRTWTEDQYGRPILLQQYEAIYPKGCRFPTNETNRD